jgi:hypothetical protein
VFVSGVLLLFEGPAHRGAPLLIHKASFFAWLAVTGFHVLGHLPRMPASLRITPQTRTRVPGHHSDGGAGRAIALVGAFVGGLVLALVLIPDFSVWTSAGRPFFSTTITAEGILAQPCQHLRGSTGGSKRPQNPAGPNARRRG